MSNLWRPNPRYKNRKDSIYLGRRKRFRLLKSKFFLQTLFSILIFFFIWLVFQFNTPLLAGMQDTMRSWFTKDTDITPVIKVIKEIGFYGDSFERAGYEVISPNLEPQTTEPMTIPVSGTVVRPYGWTMVKGQSSFYEGILIEATKGAPIKAAYDGTVLEVKNDNKLGRTIVISHKDGLVTTYGYCSEILVRADQYIKQGQVIGKVGGFKDSTKGYIYFEVRRLGEPVNPIDLLEKNKGI